MTISVILVVYKTLEWIEACLNSIFEQSYKDFELIIINNDDDDVMDDTIRGFIAEKDNVRYFRNRENIGGAKACNQGIRLAKGEYVFLMDSDDLLPADALEHLATTADATASDIIIGRGKIIRKGKTHNVDYRPDWISWERPITVNSIHEAPYISFNPYYWGRLYRRSMLIEKDVFLMEDAINADRNFNCRALIAASSISVTPQNTYLWRKHAVSGDYKSITQSRKQEQNFLDRVRMMEKTDDEFKKTGDEDLYQYSRISGLMRILILAADTADDPEFRELFLNTMHDYLSTFSYEQISDCEFLSYRIKTLAYLIKSGNFEDFDTFVKEETDITPRIENDRIIYSYSDIDVPRKYRSQYIYHLPVVNAELTDRDRDGVVIKGRARLPEGCVPDPTGICLMDRHKAETARIDIKDSNIENDTLFFSALITNDILAKLNEGEKYYLTLYYIVHLRAGRTKMTDSSGNVCYLFM